MILKLSGSGGSKRFSNSIENEILEILKLDKDKILEISKRSILPISNRTISNKIRLQTN